MKEENWFGTPGDENLPNQPTGNLVSACECEALCHTNPECRYWVFEAGSEKSVCWQKKNFKYVENWKAAQRNSEVTSGWGANRGPLMCLLLIYSMICRGTHATR